MELLTLSLENFQGLKHEEIQLDGHSASIYGRNASGKTTIFNAITWLLFGKPAHGQRTGTPRRRAPTATCTTWNTAQPAPSDWTTARP